MVFDCSLFAIVSFLSFLAMLLKLSCCLETGQEIKPRTKAKTRKTMQTRQTGFRSEDRPPEQNTGSNSTLRLRTSRHHRETTERWQRGKTTRLEDARTARRSPTNSTEAPASGTWQETEKKNWGTTELSILEASGPPSRSGHGNSAGNIRKCGKTLIQ